MADTNISRRIFLAAAGAAQAAAQTRQPVASRPDRGPIRIVTMHSFEPDEVQKIQAAVPNLKVEVVQAENREAFRNAARDAEVIFGEPRGADLDYAPKVKWVQVGGAGM